MVEFAPSKAKRRNVMEEEKDKGLYDDLPMPKWAAFVGLLTSFIICLILTVCGRCLGHLATGNGFKLKVGLFDIALSFVVGTIWFFKTRKVKRP